MWTVDFGDRVTKPATAQWAKLVWAHTCSQDTYQKEQITVWAAEQDYKHSTKGFSFKWYHPVLNVFIVFIYLSHSPRTFNSIKSRLPHSLCGLLRSKGREAVTWTWEKRLYRIYFTKKKKKIFLLCLWAKLLKRIVESTPGSDSASLLLLLTDTSCAYLLSWHQCSLIYTNKPFRDLSRFAYRPSYSAVSHFVQWRSFQQCFLRSRDLWSTYCIIDSIVGPVNGKLYVH